MKKALASDPINVDSAHRKFELVVGACPSLIRDFWFASSTTCQIPIPSGNNPAYLFLSLKRTFGIYFSK